MNKPRTRRPPSRPRDTSQKFELPVDFKFHVYTNDEIMAILQSYNSQLFDHLRKPVSTETINTILTTLDRSKFLVQQIKQGKK